MPTEPWHDPRIDLLKSAKLRTVLTKIERSFQTFFSDPELLPLTGAVLLALLILVSTRDHLFVFTHTGASINLWLAFMFLLGVQYGRVYWRRK